MSISLKSFSSFFLLGTFFLFFSGCGEDPQQTPVETFVTPSSSFFISVPDDWESLPLDENLTPHSTILVKREPSFSDEISSHITISLNKGETYPLEKAVLRNLETTRKASQDFQKISQENIFLSSGQPAIFVEYTERYSKTKAMLGFYELYIEKEDAKELYSLTILFDPKTSQSHKDFLKNVLLSFHF